MTQIDQLRTRLAEIDKRLVEIDTALAGAATDRTSYKRQELASEAGDLRAWRRVTATQLDALLHPLAAPAVDPDYERFVEAEVATRKESRMHFIESLEKQGELRQARIHRMALLNLRAEVERELPPRPSAA